MNNEYAFELLRFVALYSTVQECDATMFNLCSTARFKKGSLNFFYREKLLSRTIQYVISSMPVPMLKRLIIQASERDVSLRCTKTDTSCSYMHARNSTSSQNLYSAKNKCPNYSFCSQTFYRIG